MFSFLELIKHLNISPIQAIDAGAALFDTDKYRPLLEQNLIHMIGFEPNSEEYQKCVANATKNRTYLPYALGNGSEETLYCCKNPLLSSLYKPNYALLNKFSIGIAGFEVIKEEAVQTHRLENISEVQRVDYIKLDVQGAELDILQGMGSLLNDTLIVETEIEFLPMYEGQPLFGDLDLFLRKKGFQLFKIEGIMGNFFRPFVSLKEPFPATRQWLTAEHAIYIKDFMKFDQLLPEALIKLAILLHDLYDASDFCALALEQYDLKTNSTLRNNYLEKFKS
ncbi:MAG: hypothetical protein K0S74_1817 [Chlamydiales bacterium]|jgi:FkbM family methyltransferase|nr:hypothetical protein [Chlamydiales bacterium]